MAQIKDDLLQNETLEIATKRNVMWVAGQTGHDNHVGAKFVLEASWNGGANFYQCDLTDPSDIATPLADLTGVDKAGYARIPGADVVRFRRTDANGASGVINMTTISAAR